MSDRLKTFQWVSGCFVPAATSSLSAGQSLDTDPGMVMGPLNCGGGFMTLVKTFKVYVSHNKAKNFINLGAKWKLL